MPRKPAYEELEQRVIKLEEEVAQHKLIEEELIRTEEKYKVLFEGAAEGILVADIETKEFKYANPAICRMLGYTEEELKQLRVPDIHPKEALGHVIAEFEAQARGEKTLAANIPCMTRDGSIFYADIRTTKVLIDGHEFNIGFFTDITERKRVEDALAESERRFRELAELLPETIYEMDLRGKLLFVNLSAFEQFGYSQQDFLRGLNCFDMIVPEDRHRAQRNFEKILEGQNLGPSDYTAQRKDGTTFPVILRSTAILCEGKPVGLRGVIIDITALKKAEKALKAERDQAQTYLDLAGAIFVALDTKGEVILINKKGCEVLGYEEEEVVGKNWYDNFLPGRLTDQVSEVTDLLLTGKEDLAEYYEDTVVTKHGKERLIAWHNTVLRNEEGDIIGHLSSGEDITERRQAEEAYRTLVDQSLQGLAIFQDMRVIFANKIFAKTIGYSADELLSLSPEKLEAMVFCEDRELVWGRLRKRLDGKEVPKQYEFRYIRKDGTVGWLETHASMTEYKRKPAVQAAFMDITDRKRAEELLLKNKKELEQQAQNLQELNIALKVLVEYRDQERERLEEYVLKNVEELISPYIEKLEKGGLDTRNSQFLSIIKKNIEDLVSPFAKTLSSKYSHLTPTETQIASLVKQGKTSKEIASLLDVSSKAIEFHRSNIREKLGLLNKKANLRSYLVSVNE